MVYGEALLNCFELLLDLKNDSDSIVDVITHNIFENIEAALFLIYNRQEIC